MCPELEPRPAVWDLVLLPGLNIPGCGLETASLVCERSLWCSPCVLLIFSCLVYLACFRSLVLVLASVCWSLQLDQTWGQMKRGLRGEGGVQSSVKWGGDHSQGPFELFFRRRYLWCGPREHCWCSWLCLLPSDGGYCSSGLFSLSFAVSNAGKCFAVSM